MLVTCSTSELWTCDPEIAIEVLSRPKDFEQPGLGGLFWNKFGPNVLSSDGAHWSRQRRVIARAMNEPISNAVFQESIRQTNGLVGELHSGTSQSDDAVESNRVFDMIKKVAIHVLSGVGMDINVPWQENDPVKARHGFQMTHTEVITTIIDNIRGPIILLQCFLSRYPSFLPGSQSLRSLSRAIQEYPKHTGQMLDAEFQRLANPEGGEARRNIMSHLLRASETSAGSHEKGRAPLNEEVMGNLFVFTVASFDTTANTLAYAIILLTRYPQWQEWFLEEIDDLSPLNTNTEGLEYAAIWIQKHGVISTFPSKQKPATTTSYSSGLRAG